MAKKKRTFLDRRSPATKDSGSSVLLALVALVLLGGCATRPPRGSLLSGFGTHAAAGSAGGFLSRETDAVQGAQETRAGQEVLARFLACTSPAEFIELQRQVDMPWLVEGLDDWSAVRLGALGPLRSEAGARILNRKRAAFLVTATREYGAARAELFALFLLHSAFTNDLHGRDLSLLEEKALKAQMVADAREALRYYGETLNIRRLSLELLDKQVTVHRVRLIYEGGALIPMKPEDLGAAMRAAEKRVKGVEVLFQ
ncbi:hypothetical protein F0U60_00585 [Archangium minus]|uniref:Lipoprotein n=1 Tax=Archangium minus TaxID=83450 RepID=A0ABY9WG40_9BACT|nr:hypothetical protein F0U60_00585 [Archangium minus]